MSTQTSIDAVLNELVVGDEPSRKLTKDEAAELITGIKVISGGGFLRPLNGRNQHICIMQVANLYNAAISGEPVQGGTAIEYTGIDEICPVMEQFMIAVNDCDNCSPENRQKLIEFVPRLLNTHIDEKTSRRAEILRDVIANWTWSWWLKSGRTDDPLDVVAEWLDEADDDFVPSKIKKDVWIAAVRDNFEITYFGEDNCGFIYALIEREGFDTVLRLTNRLLRAR